MRRRAFVPKTPAHPEGRALMSAAAARPSAPKFGLALLQVRNAFEE